MLYTGRSRPGPGLSWLRPALTQSPDCRMRISRSNILHIHSELYSSRLIWLSRLSSGEELSTTLDFCRLRGRRLRLSPPVVPIDFLLYSMKPTAMASFASSDARNRLMRSSCVEEADCWRLSLGFPGPGEVAGWFHDDSGTQTSELRACFRFGLRLVDAGSFVGFEEAEGLVLFPLDGDSQTPPTEIGVGVGTSEDAILSRARSTDFFSKGRNETSQSERMYLWNLWTLSVQSSPEMLVESNS